MTWKELQALWRERDSRYAVRKIGGMALPISDVELDAIMTWRRSEARELSTVQEQDQARLDLLAWTPPQMTVYR